MSAWGSIVTATPVKPGPHLILLLLFALTAMFMHSVMRLICCYLSLIAEKWYVVPQHRGCSAHQLHVRWPNFLTHHKIRFYFCWRSATNKIWNTEIIWHTRTHTWCTCCVCAYGCSFLITQHNKREKIIHNLAFWLLCKVENTWSWGSLNKGEMRE